MMGVVTAAATPPNPINGAAIVQLITLEEMVP